ncbi:Protein LOL1 [Glycine max]|nr:Protein LOL1 [Glycine max]
MHGSLREESLSFDSYYVILFANLFALQSASQVSLSVSAGAQSQLVCSGCRNLLLYPVGATSVCCAVCNAVTTVPPPGTEMAQLVCGGCHTFLMYIRGATSVQCSCCHTVNLALEANLVAHVNCGNCKMLLRPRQAPLSRNSAPKSYCKIGDRHHDLGFNQISPLRNNECI